jgi:hypothetical protein
LTQKQESAPSPAPAACSVQRAAHTHISQCSLLTAHCAAQCGSAAMVARRCWTRCCRLVVAPPGRPNHGPRAPHRLPSVKAFRDGCRANDVWPINLACRDAGRRSAAGLPRANHARRSRYPPSTTPSDGL